jgi:hypothetical protein
MIVMLEDSAPKSITSTKQVVEQNATTFGKPGSVQRIDFPGRGFQ